MLNCPLCLTKITIPFVELHEATYFECRICFGIFKSPHQFISADEEKTVYLNHNNDVNDERYQQFTSPIHQAIETDFKPAHKGLDFGSGTGPVITSLLKEKGYNIKPYDPFFEPNESLLKKTYDYIACCEVIEHFHNPQKEFKLLYELLNTNGKLYCMTHLYSTAINVPFADWYYRKDPTHVFIYQPQTINWITKNMGFNRSTITDRLIIFEK